MQTTASRIVAPPPGSLPSSTPVPAPLPDAWRVATLQELRACYIEFQMGPDAINKLDELSDEILLRSVKSWNPAEATI